MAHRMDVREMHVVLTAPMRREVLRAAKGYARRMEARADIYPLVAEVPDDVVWALHDWIRPPSSVGGRPSRDEAVATLLQHAEARAMLRAWCEAPPACVRIVASTVKDRLRDEDFGELVYVRDPGPDCKAGLSPEQQR